MSLRTVIVVCVLSGTAATAAAKELYLTFPI